MIMNLKDSIKKILKEEFNNDLDFLGGNPNPFMGDDPLVVVWLDETTTKEQINDLWGMLEESGSYLSISKETFIDSVFNDTSKYGIAYIKTYQDPKDTKRMSFGDNEELFRMYKYVEIREDLKGKPYTEYHLKDIFN